MRDTPTGIIEELREAARVLAAEIGVPMQDAAGWEAADYIEHLRAALARIKAGEEPASLIAEQALDAMAWMLSDFTG